MHIYLYLFIIFILAARDGLCERVWGVLFVYMFILNHFPASCANIIDSSSKILIRQKDHELWANMISFSVLGGHVFYCNLAIFSSSSFIAVMLGLSFTTIVKFSVSNSCSGVQFPVSYICIFPELSSPFVTGYNSILREITWE
jgi:hypothetical protein